MHNPYSPHRPIGYKYPDNYFKLHVASPHMNLNKCEKTVLYKCNGEYYMKPPKGCKIVQSCPLQKKSISHRRPKRMSPRLGRRHSISPPLQRIHHRRPISPLRPIPLTRPSYPHHRPKSPRPHSPKGPARPSRPYSPKSPLRPVPKHR